MPSVSKREQREAEDQLVLAKIEQVQCSLLPSKQDLGITHGAPKTSKKKQKSTAIVPSYLAEKHVDGNYLHVPVVTKPSTVTRYLLKLIDYISRVILPRQHRCSPEAH